MKSVTTLLFLLGVFWLGQMPAAKAQTPKNCYRADPNQGARDHKLDYLKMSLDVAFEPQEGRVIGNVTHRFKPLRANVDSFYLDGPGITYKQVQLGGNAVNYQVDENGIHIYPDESLDRSQTYELSISYSATPRKGIYFIGWDERDSGSRKQIWTQGQGTDNRHWFPCYDNPNDKLITNLTVTFDSRYEVLSNGEQLDVQTNPKAGTKTWEYETSHPHTTYLVMLAIGQYGIEKRTTANDVPLHLYYYPEEPEKVNPTYNHSKAMMNIMESETGISYPWSQYSQVPVQDFLYGAMENTTATIFGDFYYGNERQQLDQNYAYVNAHELAHHWFGDYITLNSDEHIWLHESFATHYGRLCEKHLFGDQYYQKVREQQLQRALTANDKNTRPIMHTGAGVSRIYPKGALVIGMLKDVVGKAAFNRVLTHYLQEHAYENVTTHDLIMAFQEVLGQNLNWFFEQWIKRGGIPHYQVDYKTTRSEEVALTVRQVHETNDLVKYYRMPITVKVRYADGQSVSRTFQVDGPVTQKTIPNPGEEAVDYVIFDPGNRVIKRETFPQSVETLTTKATEAELMIDRYDALKKLRDKPNNKKKAALRTIYNAADYHFVKAEALRQLTAYPASEVMRTLRKGLSADHHEVRRVVLKNLNEIPAPLLPLYEKSLQDSSFLNVELALEALVNHQPENLNTYLTTTKRIDGLNNHNVRITWLELAIKYKSKEYRSELVKYASPSYEFRTRVNAMKALKRLNHCNKQVIKNLVDGYLNPNGRLSRPAKQVLKHFYEQHHYKRMIEQFHEDNYWPDYAEGQWDQLLN